MILSAKKLEKSNRFSDNRWHTQRGATEISTRYLTLSTYRSVAPYTNHEPTSGEYRVEGELRSKWSSRIVEAARKMGVPVDKPSRFGIGNTMTVGIWKGDYRVANSEGCLDFDATVEVLRDAAKVLDLAAKPDGE